MPLFKLSEKEKNILRLFADILIPVSEKLPLKCSELNIVEDIESSLQNSSKNIQKAFKLALAYLQNRAYLHHALFKNFTQMSLEEAHSYLASWHSSVAIHRKALLRLLEAMVMMMYYGHPKVYSQLSYQVKEPRKEASGILRSELVVTDLKGKVELQADVCIIGSGAGAAPLAAELAEKGLKVLILEEGGVFDLSNFKGEAVHRSKNIYRDAGLFNTLGVPPIILPLGKAVGGTTLINSGTCFRIPNYVFEKWNKIYNLNNLTPEELDPFYSRVEKEIHVHDVEENILGNSAKILREGFKKLNLNAYPLKRNAKDCEGSGLCCFGCPTDAKQSVQLNYIPRALLAGAKLIPHCKVEFLKSQHHQIKEVKAKIYDPISKKVQAEIKVKAKYTVLAAGAIHSPVLLKASQLAHLSGECGRNLSLHPAGKVIGLFDQEVRGWEGVPQSFYCPDYHDEGIMLEGIFTPPSLISTGILSFGRHHKQVMENYSHLASFGFMITDEAKGRILRQGNGDPLVLYSLSKNDFKKFLDATLILSRIFFEAGAKELYLPIHSYPVVKNMDEITDLYSKNLKPKDFELHAFHPLGSCRMGNEAESSVVNSFGRVHDMQNLYISDGSIFPSSLGVNPQLSIMAFSLRTAQHLLKHF